MTTEPTFVSIQFDLRDLPRLAQAVAVARSIVSDRAATAEPGHPIITDDVLLHALYGELHKAAQPRQENPMTTEQMDEKDRQYNYVGVTAQSLVDGQSTADRRKAAADAAPVILYGNPSKEEIAEARGRAGSRGVMVLPEEMRGSTIASGGGWWSPTPDETMENLTPPADEQARDECRATHADEPYDDPHLGNEYDHYTERARVICAGGDHESAVALDRQAEHEKVAAHEAAEQDRIWREGGIVDMTRHCEDTMFKVQAAFTELGYSGLPVLDIIGSLQNAGILFRERAPEYEAMPADEYTGSEPGVAAYLRDRKEYRAPDDWEIRSTDETTMAEEPIENRLRRAWLNGFRDGVDRASFAATESTGKWDY